MALRRLRTIGFCLLGLQLLAWGWWSARTAGRSALTWDYSLYNQAVYLIAHGHLNPYSSTFGYPFWKNDGEFIFWPVSIFEAIWPHIVTLKWAQDIAVAVAELVAFIWICEIAASWNKRYADVRLTVALAALGLLMLVADPWLTWAISFDVHAEPFAVPFMVLAARAFYKGQRIAWFWALCVISCGAVAETYAGALGLTLIVSGRRWWRQGLALAVIAFGWESILQKLGASHGAGVGLYWQILGAHAPDAATFHASLGTLAKAMVEHPGRVFTALWHSKTDMWATVAPLGAIGLLWPPALIPSIIVLAEGGLTQGYVFSFPGFQNAVLAPLVAAGTVAACFAVAARTRQRRPWLPWFAGGLLAANAITWAVIWLPQTSAHWLRVPSNSAAVMSVLRSKIPSGDEVVAQQGVIGAFSDHKYIYTLLSSNATVPAKTRHVWVVLAPEVSVETAGVSGILADVRQMTADRNFRLVASGHGVWGFEWTRPAGARSLTIGQTGHGYLVAVGSSGWKASLGLEPVTSTSATIDAWTAAGEEGRVVRQGPPSDWYATNTGQSGYVVDHAYWLEPPGHYTAGVTLDVSGQTNVEVWDATSSTLLGRQVLTDTHGRRTVTMQVTVPGITKQKLFGGWGLWAVRGHPPLAGESVEVRVWTAAAPNTVRVYTVQIH